MESIGSNHGGAKVKQLLAFGGCNVGNRCEAVGCMCGSLLKRVFRLHVELAGHLVAVISGQIIVEGLAVAAYRATDGCGVGGEYGADERKLPVGIKEAHAGGPFIKMSQHILMAYTLEIAYALYHDAGGSEKQQASS